MWVIRAVRCYFVNTINKATAIGTTKSNAKHSVFTKLRIVHKITIVRLRRHGSVRV